MEKPRWYGPIGLGLFLTGFGVAAGCSDDATTDASGPGSITSPTDEGPPTTVVTSDTDGGTPGSIRPVPSLTTNTTSTVTSETVGAPDVTIPIPDNARAYADALFLAWVDQDVSELTRLSSSSAYQVLISRPPTEDEEWESAQCDAATGELFCQWSGSSDDLVVSIDIRAAGDAEEGAVRDARFE